MSGSEEILSALRAEQARMTLPPGPAPTINRSLEIVRALNNRAARSYRDTDGIAWLTGVPPLIPMLVESRRSPYPIRRTGFDEGVDNPHRVVVADVASRHSGSKVTWLRSSPSMNRFMRRPAQSRCLNLGDQRDFTQPGPEAAIRTLDRATLERTLRSSF
jgi:hypothetical protein